MNRWWVGKTDGQRIGIVAIVCAVIAMIFAIPFTRAIVLFILPLGSGWDDFVFLTAVIGAVVFGIVRLLRKGD